MSERVVWELREQVLELRAELAEAAQREQERERELAALRHELELRIARDAANEERVTIARSQLEEVRGHLRWLTGHTDAVTERFDEARQALAALQAPGGPGPAPATGPGSGDVAQLAARLAATEAELAAARQRVAELEAGGPPPAPWLQAAADLARGGHQRLPRLRP